ncbi:OmpA family protein [Leptospira yanagawae serovar Saopaulo str. Sao Paulo = ATCC 700523]|uniref:OmpA family protein n=1 Tax=Leptospira yanagawae serovar Saopaulo str. Sao Paulo = ATCC 700523 TaxID=1249483 RepID=A0A5E8HAZ0_9LEPT|nr:OmpA family protein [Leptospira yanagawae]EOQ87810.1 OmpA family protein [Leptospira yanagawae serovar Saopaulo str. Sao Paulo = ATCC 700523]
MFRNLLIISFSFLFAFECQTTTKPEWMESESFQKFCGCVHIDESKPSEHLGSLPVGSLDKLGTPEYLEKLYKGLKSDFEHTGTPFEEVGGSLVAKGVELKRIEDDEKRLRELLIIIDGDVAFPSGKSTLTPKAKELIAKVGDAMEAYPETNCRIGGHTDSVGAFSMNLKLSKERSQSVKKELKLVHKIAEERFKEVDGYADQYKIVDTMLAEKKNRRTEIYVGTVRIVY